MPKNSTSSPSLASKPLQLRLSPDIRARLNRIATANGISVLDVVRLSLSSSLPAIEEKGLTIQPAKAA